MAYLKLLIISIALTAVFAGKSKLGESCAQTNNCIDNAECKFTAKDNEMKCLLGVCDCKSSHKIVGDKCEARKNYDATCTVGANACDDKKLLTCTNGKCRCMDKYKWESNKCVIETEKAWDEACTIDAECVKGYKNGACIQQKCHCNIKYTYVSDHSDKCVKQDRGDSCDKGTNDKCRFTYNLECKDSDKKCNCKSGFKYDDKRKYCIKDNHQTNKNEKDLCTFGIGVADTQYLDCGSKLTCRRCSSDRFGTAIDGVCVKTSDITGSGVSHYVSFSILLTGILAYLAF